MTAALRAVLTLSLLAASAVATPYQNCGSRMTLTDLEVVGCDALPCPLKKGTKVQLNAKITADAATDTLASSISGVISGVPVPFSNDDKACDSLTSGSCPLAAGDKVEFSTSVNVLEAYPSIQVTIKWELKDDKGDDMLCALIPAHIV